MDTDAAAEGGKGPGSSLGDPGDVYDRPVLAFTGTGVVFPGGTNALESVTLTVRAREMVALVGPSGCGKSTLLRLAAGLQRPSTGEVAVTADRVGYVFQDATLLPWRSVRRNVELPGQLAGVPVDERRRVAAEAVARVGLTGFEDHKPAQLSGGMRMRVSIARALTTRPQLFLFDEPFGALDELTRERLGEELDGLFAAGTFAAVFVTHSVAESVYLADRVIVMSGRPGRIVAEVPVPFPRPRPADLRYEASFGAVAAEVSHALRAGTGPQPDSEPRRRRSEAEVTA